ncbi:MurR/RpiR family transcriptional regulator [Kiloniella laminariae]|uniref:MurR/RpiR family transcriptional regulator n=1 Tax=Kiloniella laminariae TaxID=454162 RepID=UPI0003686942|nr:MurR/RpiR family transcriptional regulator [Kiloniella laminariae]
MTGKQAMTFTIDLISQLRQLDGSFHSREQLVASYVLDNLEQVTQATVSDIAAAVGVSEPTVIRFCRTLGCSGFRDFKIKLAQNLAVSVQYMTRVSDGDVSPGALVDQVLGVLVQVASDARSQLDPARLEAAMECLAQARQVVFFGVGGGSSTVANDASNRFFRLGIPTASHCDGYLQRMQASTLGKGDVVFAISATGKPQELLDSVGIAQQYGARTICLTKRNSPLAEACDIAIVLDLPEDPDIYKPTASRLVFLAIIDVLAAGVARKLPEQAKEKLRRIRSSLVALHKSTDPQPIGD